MRIVFFGTAPFGEPTLRALDSLHDVPAVVTGCATRQGRGQKFACSAIETVARELGKDVLTPTDFGDPAFRDALAGYHADLFVVVAFRILPREVFGLPPQGTVNLHASLLPDYRGASPITWAVVNGETETGLTTFFITDRVDAGDILLAERLGIDPDETAGELALRMKGIGADLMVRTVAGIETGTLHPVPQPAGVGRYACRLCHDNGRIDWTMDARQVHNLVRGMNPMPGAFTDTTGGPFKIHRTAMVDEATPGTPGQVITASGKTGLVIACGRGAVELREVQPPGRPRMDGASFVRGYRIEAGVEVSSF